MGGGDTGTHQGSRGKYVRSVHKCGNSILYASDVSFNFMKRNISAPILNYIGVITCSFGS